MLKSFRRRKVSMVELVPVTSPPSYKVHGHIVTYVLYILALKSEKLGTNSKHP